MSFKSGFTKEIPKVGAGEIFNPSANTVLTATTFEEGLVVGRFAKLDAGSLDNLDGSVTPLIAGVVVRDVTAAVEEDNTLTAKYHPQANYVRAGMVTVEVADGQTPAQFGEVFASNAGDANDGKALTAAGEATGAEFIKEIKAGVWLIRLK